LPVKLLLEVRLSEAFVQRVAAEVGLLAGF
jgi:hypothetical protein